MPPMLALQVLDRPTARRGQDLIQSIGFIGGLGQSWEPAILNRVVPLNSDEFVHISFTDLTNQGKSATATYIEEILTKGVMIGDRLFLYYGHSNSQLKARSCFLIAADSLEDSSAIINRLGNFSSINEVGKRAKRIGLLFSSSEHMFDLEEKYAEISDIERNGQIFTDGCGIISEEFAAEIKRKYLTRRNKSANVPSVFQIRYKGYKGILMVVKKNTFEEICGRANVNTQAQAGFFKSLFTSWFGGNAKDTKTEMPQVIFRHSMRKFTDCPLNEFCILDYSKPLAGKLNGELICILSTLGVPDEVFLKKQNEYFAFIRNAPRDLEIAKKFLEYRGCQDLVNKLRDYPTIDCVPKWILDKINKHQREEKESFDKYDLEKIRIRIPKSRLLFGVCDISGKLKEGQCFVKISSSDGSTAKNLTGPVIVGRNPCLHPGDIQQFIAIDANEIPELEHLQDCIVFSTNGQTPPASTMSGGDLDGDKFFVCWDNDLRPPRFETPLDYSALAQTPQPNQGPISELDLIKYFAHYSTSLGEIMELYWAWIRGNPRGKRAASKQCRFLTKLYSKCVDGERINIPGWVKQTPRPDMSEEFILDKLKNNLRNNFDKNLESAVQDEENEPTDENENENQFKEVINKVGYWATRPFVWSFLIIWCLIMIMVKLPVLILKEVFVVSKSTFLFIVTNPMPNQHVERNRNRNNPSNNRNTKQQNQKAKQQSWIWNWNIFPRNMFEQWKRNGNLAARMTLCVIFGLFLFQLLDVPQIFYYCYIILIVWIFAPKDQDRNQTGEIRLYTSLGLFDRLFHSI